MSPKTATSQTQQSAPMSVEEQLAKLQADFEKSNKNMTDNLQLLINQLQLLINQLTEMKRRQCELPPFCET